MNVFNWTIDPIPVAESVEYSIIASLDVYDVFSGTLSKRYLNDVEDAIETLCLPE